MIKIAINADLKHYSFLIKETAPYKNIKKCILIFGLLFLISLIFTVVNGTQNNRIDTMLAMLTAVLLGAFIGFALRLKKMDPIKLHEKFKSSNPNLTGENVFNSEGVVIDAHTDFGDKHSVYTYDKFCSAVEKVGFFLVSIPVGGYIVFNNSDFIEGSPDELRALFREKLGAKYKV